jgi:hypothetical protein
MAENSVLCPISLTSWFDPATGQPKQANAFFYKAQTLDPIVVYTDAGLNIPYPQPVVTTGYSRMPPIYVGEFPVPGYRIRVFDQFQVLIEDLDMLPGAVPTVPPPAPDVVDPSALARTGDMKAMWSNHATFDGWVECNGKSIGNALSNATGKAHATETHALFIWLWGQDAQSGQPLLAITPNGRGASAEGDWQDNKAIATPDMRGRLIGGLDGYDAANQISSSGRLDKGLFDLLPNITEADKPYQPVDYMKPWMLGGSGGESVHKLVPTELAVHLHDWVDVVGHTHYVYDPGHVHGVTDPGHTHGIETDAPSTNNVMGRMVSGGAYNPTSQVGGPFGQVALSTLSHGAGITVKANRVYTDPPYIQTVNSNWGGAAGTPGQGQGLQWVGTWDTVAKRWHQPTENFPKPYDGSIPPAADMGDQPHNNLPNFLLVCWYIKL